jgi:hypothetical protein
VAALLKFQRFLVAVAFRLSITRSANHAGSESINPAEERRALDEERSLEDIRTEIQSTNNLHRSFINFSIPPKLRENIELRHYDLPATYLS